MVERRRSCCSVHIIFARTCESTYITYTKCIEISYVRFIQNIDHQWNWERLTRAIDNEWSIHFKTRVGQIRFSVSAEHLATSRSYWEKCISDWNYKLSMQLYGWRFQPTIFSHNRMLNWQNRRSFENAQEQITEHSIESHFNFANTIVCAFNIFSGELLHYVHRQSQHPLYIMYRIVWYITINFAAKVWCLQIPSTLDHYYEDCHKVAHPNEDVWIRRRIWRWRCTNAFWHSLLITYIFVVRGCDTWENCTTMQHKTG